MTRLTPGLLVFLLLITTSFSHAADARDPDEKLGLHAERSLRLSLLWHRIVKDVPEALVGKESAFQSLETSRDEFDEILNGLSKGDNKLKRSPSPSEIRHNELRNVINSWSPAPEEGLRAEIEAVLSRRDDLIAFRGQVTAIVNTVPQLIATIDELLEKSVSTGAKGDFSFWFSRHALIAHRISANVQWIALLGDESRTAAWQLADDIKLLMKSQGILRKRAPKNFITSVDQIGEIARDINQSAADILGSVPELFVAQRAARQVSVETGQLFERVHLLVLALHRADANECRTK